MCSTLTCGTLDLLQRSGSEIRSAFFSRAASSKERAVISHPSGTCCSVPFCRGPMEPSVGPDSFHTVNVHMGGSAFRRRRGEG